MASTDDWYEAEQIHRAAQDGNLVEIMRLIREGLDINAFDILSRTPLHYAVEKEHYLVAKWLLENGAEVNANEEERIGETPLSLAVQGNYPEIVELLLKHGAKPDISGWMGLTARTRAKKRNDDDGMKIDALLTKYCPKET
jgi:ankyrin repeat protein